MVFSIVVMLKNAFIIATFLVLAAASSMAQADSTRYINGLPVSEDDTATHIQQIDVEPYNRLVPVTAQNLPEELVDVLNEEEQYTGWQDTVVYYQANTRLFIVPVKYSEGIKIFGMTEKGKPVSFSEVSKKEDQ